MPGTAKVKDVLRRASFALQDIDPQFSGHPERHMVDALNDAQSAIYTYIPLACSRIDAIKLKPGVLQSIESIAPGDCKPSDGSTPAVPIIGSLLLGVECNMGSAGTVPGRAIRAIVDGRELLDSINPYWSSEFGTEVVHFLFDPSKPRNFYAIPGAPPTTPVWVRAAFVASPLAIPNTGTPGSELYADAGASTTTITVHDDHISDLVNYVCARMLMRLSRAAAGTGLTWQDYEQLFVSSVNAKSVAVMGYNPNLKKLPFSPAMPGGAS